MANTAQSEADPSDDGPSPDLTEYRQSLVAAEQTMQGEYDKGVLTLSGGALGISLVFLKDVVGPKPLKEPGFLLASWIVWGLSIGFVLASYFTSTKALRRAVADVDHKTIFKTLAHSGWATATKALNALGGLSFFIGIILLVAFVSFNLPK